MPDTRPLSVPLNRAALGKASVLDCPHQPLAFAANSLEEMLPPASPRLGSLCRKMAFSCAFVICNRVKLSIKEPVQLKSPFSH